MHKCVHIAHTNAVVVFTDKALSTKVEHCITQQFHASAAVARALVLYIKNTFLLVIWQTRSRFFTHRTNVAVCIPKVHKFHPSQQTIDSHWITAPLQQTTGI